MSERSSAEPSRVAVKQFLLQLVVHSLHLAESLIVVAIACASSGSLHHVDLSLEHVDLSLLELLFLLLVELVVPQVLKQ